MEQAPRITHYDTLERERVSLPLPSQIPEKHIREALERFSAAKASSLSARAVRDSADNVLRDARNADVTAIASAMDAGEFDVEAPARPQTMKALAAVEDAKVIAEAAQDSLHRAYGRLASQFESNIGGWADAVRKDVSSGVDKLLNVSLTLQRTYASLDEALAVLEACKRITDGELNPAPEISSSPAIVNLSIAFSALSEAIVDIDRRAKELS